MSKVISKTAINSYVKRLLQVCGFAYCNPEPKINIILEEFEKEVIDKMTKPKYSVPKTNGAPKVKKQINIGYPGKIFFKCLTGEKELALNAIFFDTREQARDYVKNHKVKHNVEDMKSKSNLEYSVEDEDMSDTKEYRWFVYE